MTKGKGGPRRLLAGGTGTKWAIQAASFCIFLVLLLLLHDPWRSGIPYRLFLDLDPLVSLASFFGTRQVWVGGALLLVVALLWGRVFCGYVCPLGFCIDLADGALGRSSDRRGARTASPGRRQAFLATLPWIVLGTVAVGLLLRNSLPLSLDPIGLLTRTFSVVFHPLGVWIVNGAIGLFRPVAERLGWYGVAYQSYVQPGFQTAVGGLLLFLLVLGVGPGTRRFWCRHLCPLGALLGVTGRFAPCRRRVTPACTTCGQCTSACPTGAIGNDPVPTKRTACIQCRSCRAVCPEDAIRFGIAGAREGSRDVAAPERLSRRGLLVGVGVGGSLAALTRLDPRVRKRTGRWLRPPGAVPEPDFLAACVRCGACLRVCVTHTLQAAGFEHGWIRWGTPIHDMRVAGCEQQCNLCGEACPTGAIRRLPLKERQHAKVGTAVLCRDRCVAWSLDRLCLLCDEACPYNAVVFREMEGHKRPVVDESRCNGCGMCESVCPVTGEAAIQVYPHGEVRLREGSYEEALHRQRIFLKPKTDLYGAPGLEPPWTPPGEGGEGW